MKTYKKWKDALANAPEVESLVLNPTNLPRVRWPATKPMPASIATLTNLREIRIRCKNLAGLCEEFATLEHLESFDIDNAEMVGFHFGDILARLPALREVELYNMSLSEPIAMPTSLERLVIQEERQLDVDAWLDSLATLPKLRALHLVNVGSEPTFEGLKKLRLTQLQLGSQLTTLPDSLRELSTLEVLRLGANAFTQLPSIIRNLQGLKELYIDHNQLTELPDWIGEFTSLEVLGISAMPMTDLPPALLRLPLRTLYLEAPDDVLAHIKQQIPGCKVISRTRADLDRQVQHWLRFLGKS